MKKFFSYADEYVKQSSWKDFALVKFCLCAAGVLIGLALPPKARKRAAIVAAFVFVVTYIPLMLKFLGIIDAHKADE